MLNRLQSNQEALKIAAVAFETQNGMTITDANQNILNVNKAFSEITGYSKEEAIGNNPSILKSGIHDKEFYTNMYDNLHKNHYWSGEIKNKRKDGEILHEYLTIQVVLDENKQIKYYIASFSDITLYKQMQKDLQQKEKILNQQSKMATMGEMLENIAHQWRQPLSIISTLATSMQIQKELYINIPRDEELDKLKKINTTTQHLSQTIEDFRDFFQPNKKKIKFNLKDAYYKTLNLINSKFKTLDIEMVENIEDIYIESYHNELIQVIMNILNNARDILVTKKDKRIIFISIYKENNNAVISIKDNAGGVPDNIIDKIFEPYFTTKHKSQGTGIGLYMSQNIITKHINGTLNVYNEEFNYNGISYKGANFIITIAL
jgi:PAS domain S-box-containing protein